MSFRKVGSVKTRVLLLLLAFGASSAAAQAPDAATPPPAAEGPPAAVPQVYITPPPSGWVPPPQGFAPPPNGLVIQPGARPYPPPPRRAPGRVRMPPPILRPVMPPPAPPPPRRYGNAGAPVSLGIGGSVLWRDEAHQRYGNDKTDGGFDVFANYDVWAPSRVFVLSAGLAYRHDARSRTRIADVKDNLLDAELVGRIRALSWLWPQLRAGVGLMTTKLSAYDGGADVHFDDRTTNVAGVFGAGLLLRTPTRALETYRGHLSSLSLGLLFEGGYVLAQDADLNLEPTKSSDVRRTTPASVSVATSTAFLRIMGVVRF